MADKPIEKWTREDWEEYLAIVPSYRLMQECVNRTAPLMLVAIGEDETGKRTMETFDSGHDPEDLMAMYVALGHHLWEEISNEPTEEEEAEEA